MRKKYLLVSLIFLGTLPFRSAALHAAQIENVSFAESARAGDRTLALHGLGLLRYKKVIKAYVAALYLAPGSAPETALQDVPKRLELHYFWAIKGPDFGKAAERIMAAAFPSSQLEPLRERVKQLHAAYRDVKPGDRYSLTYSPGTGTELSLNDRPIVTIPGADFAAVYFAIWLGEKSGNPALRQQLLKPTGKAS